jgi:transposase-like protein
MKSHARHHHNDIERARILAAYHRSDLTQREFAAQAGIGYSTLTKWLQQAQADAPSPSPSTSPTFVSVPNLFGGTTPSVSYRVRFPNGLMVELSTGFDAAELGALLERVHAL